MTLIKQMKKHFTNILDRSRLSGAATGTDAIYCFIEAQHALDELSELDRIESEKPGEDAPCFHTTCEYFNSEIDGNCGGECNGEPAIATCEKYLRQSNLVKQFAERYHQSRIADVEEMRSMIDGAYTVVELFGAEGSPSQKKWAEDWKSKAIKF